MLNIFLDNRYYFRYIKKEYPSFNYIKTIYKREYDKIVNYYRNRRSRVTTNSFLSKLIYLVSPTLETDIFSYITTLDSTSIYTSKLFGISSEKNVGRVVNNVFFNNSKEIFLYTEKDIDIQNIDKIWETLSPIRAIYTDYYKLDFPLLNGEYPSSLGSDISSYSVYEIDIRELCVMYKYWAMREKIKGNSIHPSYFVYNYVIINLLKQFTDLAVFNRLIKIFYNEYMGDAPFRHPFHITNMEEQVDSVLRNIINDIKNKQLDVRAAINRIPVIFNFNMLETLYINSYYYNKQNEWVLWASRLRWIGFIMDIVGREGKARNRELYNTLGIELRYIERGDTNIFNKLLGLNADSLRYYIKKIKSDIYT